MFCHVVCVDLVVADDVLLVALCVSLCVWAGGRACVRACVCVMQTEVRCRYIVFRTQHMIALNTIYMYIMLD